MSRFSHYSTESTPSLPDIEIHPPLSFPHPFGYDGDMSPITYANPPEPSAETVIVETPERYVVTEAVKDPKSTQVPQAVPIVEEAPVDDLAEHQEMPVIREENHEKSSSSSSSSSTNTARAIYPIQDATTQQSSSSSSVSTPPILARKATIITVKVTDDLAGQQTTQHEVPLARRRSTIKIEVPSQHPGEQETQTEVPVARRRSTQVKLLFGSDSSEQQEVPVRKASTQRIANEGGFVELQRQPTVTIVNEPEVITITPSTAPSTTSKQSKRSRILGLWRRLVAKVLKMKAQKAAGK
ncbi:hypothetical protein SLS56_004408 [Neofusicoccum ribis]|uniref:Uncharacterized protein n=1 Tax=Neofusicoccum ribis TaxID=45134 RepID=A0ABR3SWM0_9PEZI